ncbi:unnamed protein product [Adineta steineri]|uniref:CTCK domain-containing protein n=1 Tax=Adineta steineri TaxID=433720 RepID=A0A814Q325_9BILA|nr:unnamed protein product [Adineta steineri]CAF1144466.1 unnamed protein product [Adineta steineri]CAF1235256.1 unnamed protein product [Adineta steineri]CAF1249613.1 unnamed protein product [Adineta steineri]CAF1429702.1 unnamed protein product [Adineta steineri]
MAAVIIILFVLYSSIMATTTSNIHPCYMETYNETLNIRNCLDSPIEIETTRCRGQCYSEDFLIHDWQSESTSYRHNHRIHCCIPNMTIPRQILVICNNQQQRIINYPSVTRCDCKSCTDNCRD